MSLPVIHLSLSVLVLLAFALQPAAAKTWWVLKDGSGDFTVIQEALNAAADGDTVRVGPGRFGDFRKVTRPQTGLSFYSIAWITKPLVLFGSGIDKTTIGPSTLVLDIEGLTTGGVYIDEGANAHVEGFTIEKMKFPATILDTCTFARNRVIATEYQIWYWNGLALLYGDLIQIVDCEFSGELQILTASPAVTRPQIIGCTFGPGGKGIEIGNGSTEAIVTGCRFDHVEVGVSVSLSASVIVEDCIFSEIQINAIDMGHGAAIVRNCTIEPGARYPLRMGIGRLEVFDTIVGGGTTATILSWGDMYVRNSHILNGGALTVDFRGSAQRVVDLRNNWWGTRELSTIASWISDASGAVLYEPVRSGPVATGVESMGQLKALFRAEPD